MGSGGTRVACVRVSLRVFELAVYAKVNDSISRLIKAELQLGTMKYEIEQKAKLAATGDRDWALLAAHRHHAESQFVTELHDAIFHSGVFGPLSFSMG